MKKNKIIIISLLSVILFSCVTKGQEWTIEENLIDGKYSYTITSTPDSYKEYVGTLVYYKSSERDAVWTWPVSHKEEIEKYLLKNDLQPIASRFGETKLFLPHGFFVTKITQEDLSSIWELLSNNYAGFEEMKQKGFSEKKFMAIKDSKDFDDLFNKYIDDCHFFVRIRDYSFAKATARDEGTFASRDPDGFYLEKETSNAYYIRFTNCSSEDYLLNFQTACIEASKKDFIVLDARSNRGGNINPVDMFRNYLNTIDYKGTVICLQDNWSFSSGELWHTFGTPDIKFKTMLIGTHSGGMQRFDTYQYYNEKLDVFIYAGRFPNDGLISENWLGEGKGYEPQIWATTENMKSTLEKLGVELDDIQFK